MNPLNAKCFCFFQSVGLGWNSSKKLELVNSDTEFADCVFTLKFKFETTLQKFPRVDCDPNTRNKCINFADMAILHRNDIAYPPVKVNTTYDFLNYNFFAEQYAKVSQFFLLKSVFRFFKYFLLFRTPNFRQNSRDRLRKPTLHRGFIIILILKSKRQMTRADLFSTLNQMFNRLKILNLIDLPSMFGYLTTPSFSFAPKHYSLSQAIWL